MHTTTKPDLTARRFLMRGLAAGLLFTQLGLKISAQQTTDDQAPKKPDDKTVVLEEFKVTGIRMSIENSIAAKKENISVVESISSEDIGKLPDISIAESLSRLPGIAAQRVAGRASVISVRGLAPDFANTLLNGRQQVSTGDNRGVEFDQYPSELMSSVLIYKTPDASLVGQGLSGTIDLRTVRPLAFGKQIVSVGARYQTNSYTNQGGNSSPGGNRYNVTYIDQNADKTIGFAFGYSHLDDPIIAKEFGTYGWDQNGRGNAPAGTWGTGGLKTFDQTGTNKRDGFSGTLEFRPSSNFSTTFDAYYSKFIRTETDRGLEVNNGWSGPAPSPSYTAQTIQGGDLVGATLTSMYPLARNMYNKRDDKLTAFGWNAKYNADKWTFLADLSYSAADRHELNQETQGQLVDASNNPITDTATFNLATGGFPTVTYGKVYSDPSTLKVGNSIYGGGWGKVPMVNDKLHSYKVEATRSLSKFFENVDFGINYDDRTKNKRQPEGALNSNNASGWNVVSSDLLYSPANLSYANSPSSLTWNVPAVLAKYYQPFAPQENTQNWMIPKAWNVSEKIGTYYAQLNLNDQLGWAHLRGNIGLQAKNVDQSANSMYWDDTSNSAKPNSDGSKYTDILPSMNLVFELEDNQVVRFAAARQVARPRLDQMKSSFEFGVDQASGKPSGSGGNPRLEPWRANALDLSYEKYFAGKGYISLAGCYKKLTTYIYDLNDPNYDFSRYIVGIPYARTNLGNFSQPRNGNGGNLKGLEASISIPFNMISDGLDGFGFFASFTHNDSSVALDNTNLGSGIMLPGLSKTVTNLTFYYEKHGFSARISNRQRSDFIGEISGFGADRYLTYIKGENVIDCQVGYDIRTGALKGMGFVFQVYNLTDSAYQSYQATKDKIVEYQKYGRTMLLGVNYKF